MHHGVGDLNSGWKSIEDQAAHFGLKNRDQVCEVAEILLVAVNCGREMAFELARNRSTTRRGLNARRAGLWVRRSLPRDQSCPGKMRHPFRNRTVPTESSASESGMVIWSPTSSLCRSCAWRLQIDRTERMPAVNKWHSGDPCNHLPQLLGKGPGLGALLDRNTIPGFVQNCPAPSVKDACSPATMPSPRSRSAPGSTNTGLVLLISPKNGMGSGREAARSISALPALRDPVKPTALTKGCVTRAPPTCVPLSNNKEKTPSGRPHFRTLARIACPTSSLVPGCAGWALTITGLPAARAEAVSPPATEKASGKLLAPKTATGPSGREHGADVGFGRGLAVGFGLIDARPDPRPFFRNLGEETQLMAGARRLALQPGFGQGGFADSRDQSTRRQEIQCSPRSCEGMLLGSRSLKLRP